MGCLGSRGSNKHSEEESKIQSFESSLLFKTLNVVDIDRTFHRFCTNYTMSSSQLSRAFEQLKLPLTSFDRFYSKFLLRGCYEMRKLNTLGIILSQSPVEERLKVLFQNYDDDVSGSLSQTELKVMIDDVCLISCELLPVFALHLFSNDSSLYEYIRQINDVRNSIAGQICSFLTEDKKNVTFDDLLQGFKEDEGTGTLLNPSMLRRYCVKIRDSIIGTAEAAMKILDTQETIPDIYKGDQKPKVRRKSQKKTSNGTSY